MESSGNSKAHASTERAVVPRARQRAAEVSDPGFSTTLARGLALLAAFRPGDGSLSNAELGARTGLTRPTVSRLASTLIRLGYLRRGERERYALSVRTVRLAYPLLSHLRVRQLAQPLMREVAESLRATVSLGMLDGTDVVYVETSRASEVARFVPDIGAALPLARTAIGRALLSMLDAPLRAQALASIRAHDPALWTRYGAATTTGIAQCERVGYCASHGDFQPEIHAVAAPLFTSNDGDRFAINCGIALHRLKPGQLDDEIGPRIVALAASIRSLLPGRDLPAGAPARTPTTRRPE
ncbi:MAG: IclR family transcriptional regulator [Lautropia sp.]